ncbi:MAG TPA: hypothetical protein VFH14_07470 [Gemmatimonadaceae bacterium]|nr:hypothetical protein [Gemmatimonadaceae bacterium]
MSTKILLITGPVGVGKTATVAEASALLRTADVPHAVVDFDWLQGYYPRDADDPWGTRVGMQNLAALWRNYSERGIQRLLIARVIESSADLDEYRAAIPDCEIVVVRLRAQPTTLQERIRGRDHGSGRQWHLERAVVLARQMDDSPVGDHVVETEGRGLGEVAAEVLRRAGWLTDREEHRTP